VVALLSLVPGVQVTTEQLLLLAACSIAAVFIVLRFVLARFWNSRAVRAAHLFSRREQWLRERSG
jgi:hypothetical protein